MRGKALAQAGPPLVRVSSEGGIDDDGDGREMIPGHGLLLRRRRRRRKGDGPWARAAAASTTTAKEGRWSGLRVPGRGKRVLRRSFKVDSARWKTCFRRVTRSPRRGAWCEEGKEGVSSKGRPLRAAAAVVHVRLARLWLMFSPPWCGPPPRLTCPWPSGWTWEGGNVFYGLGGRLLVVGREGGDDDVLPGLGRSSVRRYLKVATHVVLCRRGRALSGRSRGGGRGRSTGSLCTRVRTRRCRCGRGRWRKSSSRDRRRVEP